MKKEFLSGFSSYHESEAEDGALPIGKNNPQKPSLGLYAEQLTGTSFTMKRHENFRTWFYRIRPSVVHSPYKKISNKFWVSNFENLETSPQQRRWLPLNEPQKEVSFLEGVFTFVKNQTISVNHCVMNASMKNQFFINSDAEMIFIPEKGSIDISTEMGFMSVSPGEIALIPRGIKVQINPTKKNSFTRFYMAENFGKNFQLPELGPIGANGLANPRDFLAPQASYFDKSGEFIVVTKFNHNFWSYEMSHHPMDVVAWHGNLCPYKYDLKKFNTMGSISYDHPDPSIFTVLTSPSYEPGKANIDFVIFPPRWLVAEDTFRPPYYHKNFMNEYMGLIYGVYDAKEEGFLPGGSSLHNRMAAHGPDAQVFDKATQHNGEPYKVDNTMAFMFESCEIFHPTQYLMSSGLEDKKYWQCWQGIKKQFKVKKK